MAIKILKVLMVSIALGVMSQAQAAIVTFNLNSSLGDVPPDGPAPYATITLDDAGSAGTVQMTVSAAGTIGAAFISKLYLNFDASLDMGLLDFTYDAGSTGPEPKSIATGSDEYRTCGSGGLYDIALNFPKRQRDRFTAGQTVVIQITSPEAMTASSFNFLSGAAGSGVSTLAFAKFQSTGYDGEGSDCVAACVLDMCY
jgi:hypothetical protein